MMSGTGDMIDACWLKGLQTFHVTVKKYMLL